MTGSRAWRVVLAAALLGALPCLAIAMNQLAPGLPKRLLDGLLGQVHAMGHWGAALFIVLQIGIALSGFLPASLLGLAAGAVYGVALGFALSAGGTMMGAWLAFRLSRSLFRSRIEHMLARRPRLRALDARLGQEDWRLVCLLRVSPVMPFAVTSYALGLSAVRPGPYMLGSLAAMPALLGYVMLGKLAETGLAADQAGAGSFRWLLLGIGAVAMIVLAARVGRMVVGVLDEPQPCELVPLTPALPAP